MRAQKTMQEVQVDTGGHSNSLVVDHSRVHVHDERWGVVAQRRQPRLGLLLIPRRTQANADVHCLIAVEAAKAVHVIVIVPTEPVVRRTVLVISSPTRVQLTLDEVSQVHAHPTSVQHGGEVRVEVVAVAAGLW